MKAFVLLAAAIFGNGLWQIYFGSTVDAELTFRQGMDSAIYGNFGLQLWRQIFELGVWAYAPDYYSQRVLPGALVHLALRATGAEITPQAVIHGFQWLSLLSSLGSAWLLWRIARRQNTPDGVFLLLGGLFFLAPYVARWFFYYPVMNDALGMLLFFGILHGHVKNAPLEVFVFSLMATFTWSLLSLVGVIFLLWPKREAVVPAKAGAWHLAGLAAALPVLGLVALAVVGRHKPYHGLKGEWLSFYVLLGFLLLLLQVWLALFVYLRRINLMETFLPGRQLKAALQSLWHPRLLYVLALVGAKQVWVAVAAPERTFTSVIPLLYAIGGAVRTPWMSPVGLVSVFGVWVMVVWLWRHETMAAWNALGKGYFLAGAGLLILAYDTEGRHHLPLVQMLLVAALGAMRGLRWRPRFWLPVLAVSVLLSRIWLQRPTPVNYGDVHMQIEFFYMNGPAQAFHAGLFLAAMAGLYLGAAEARRGPEEAS